MQKASVSASSGGPLLAGASAGFAAAAGHSTSTR
eukprot:CAMPEP_0204544740 /NCGR_PEP_ID=MMETSP0661-20131031/20745_1 /ASSEMBLY_ACC=CAM_ASM_000606 /TAXON_ID=109239 /ORGANISM="Alexandrium margalefi, Strain AMGDE01CS-322" /LENGTH=33 /DNA_ID= /DNA_START= /DNA_END= /DNA_ORIENTATION=